MPIASQHQNAHALEFRAEAGKGAIYIYRQQGAAGGRDACPVYLDGRLLGYNSPGTFLIATVSPGPRVVSAGVSQVMVTATAGGVYFVRARVAINAASITSLRLVSSEEGKQGIKQCKQTASNF